MAAARRPRYYTNALSRLTGVAPRKVADGLRYRVPCTTADGHRHSVTFQVDTHVKEVRPYVASQIARTLKVPVGQLEDVLENWTTADLQKHLSTFTKDELRPPRM